MDPISLAMAIMSFAGPIAGDLLGQVLSAGDHEKAMALVEQARQRFNIPVPTLQELTAHVDKSAFQDVKADPAAVAAQHEALASLQRYATEGSDNPEFSAAMDAGQQQGAQFANQHNAALEQEMGARGLGGSGQEYALRAQANSDAADRVGHAGFQAAGEGRREALSAMQGYGNLGTSVRGEDFNEQARRAEASDEMNRWNESNRAGAYKDRFGMDMGLATAKSNADMGAANVYQGNASQTQNAWKNAGAGAGQAAGVLGQHVTEEERRKAGKP